MSKNMLNYFNKLPKQSELLKNDEILELKKALEEIDLNPKIKTNDLDPGLLHTYLELALKSCTFITISTSSLNNNENKYKRDLAIEILDKVAKHHLKQCDLTKFSQLLNPEFFDKLLKQFESQSNEFAALNLVQLLIKILGKALHSNIGIVNPLLQIMEHAFKHSNNDIKSCGYECWRHLITNFALDKEFFFKPKKFNLLLMPLINKTKSYKSDNVSKSKALAWLCLIEGIDNKFPNYLSNVIIPFLNYCFGASSDSPTHESESISNQIDNLIKSRRAGPIIAPPVIFSETLFKIGVEFYVSLLCNGSKENIPAVMLANGFKNMNLNCNFGIESTLKDTGSWLILLKYYFNNIIQNFNLVEVDTVCFIWKRLLNLFEKNFQDKTQKSINSTGGIRCSSSSTFTLNLEDEEKDLIEYFLINSIDLINSNHLAVISINQQTPTSSSKRSSKANEPKTLQKLLINVSNILLKYIEDKEECSSFFKSERVLNELEESFNNLVDIALIQTDGSEYLTNLNQILKSIECSTNLKTKNLYQLWSLVQTKLNEHLKQLNKSSSIDLKILNNESIYMLLAFPLKHFLNFKLEPNDLKAILNQLSATCKAFTLVLKTQSTTSNSWFNSLMKYFYDQFLIEQTQAFKQKLNLEDLNKNLTKYFQQYSLFIQFIFYIFNNLFHFTESTTSQQQNSDNNETSMKFKLFAKSDCKNETNVVYLCKILNQLLDSYLSLTQINNTSVVDQQNVQNYAQTFLISYIDVVLKLTQNINSNTGEIDFILTELANVSCKLFDLSFNLKTLTKNHTENELEMKLILKYFNQTFINSKKFNDHFEHLFNELNNLLQTSPNNYNSAKKLNEYEPIVYSLFKFSSLKTQLRHKIVNTWNSTFGKCHNEPLNYSKRLEKCFHELNNDSSIILLNTTATLINNTEKDKKLAISLPGFHNCENIIVNTQTNLTPSNEKEDNLVNDENNKENSPLITNDTSMSASSSVPIVQLIYNSKKREMELKINDDNENIDSPIIINKQISSPSNSTKLSNFVFSPANSANRKSYHQNDHQQKPQSPLVTPNVPPQNLSNSATKRKLDLNSLIDQMPDTEFIKINNDQTVNLATTASPIQFKAPLTEHQKEVKKSKSFMPSEIHNVCIELTSSLLDPNQSMSCTLDFDESNPAPLNVVRIEPVEEPISIATSMESDEPIFDSTPPEEEDIEKISNDLLRESKRLRYEPSPNNKIQFHSKIKPNKHIELINMNEEDNDQEMVDLGVSEIVQETISSSKNIEIIHLDNHSDIIEDSGEKSNRRSQRIKTKLPNRDDFVNKDDEPISATQTTAIEATVEPIQQEQEDKLPELPQIKTKKRVSRRPNTITVLHTDVEMAKEIIINNTQIDLVKQQTVYDNDPDIQELSKQEEEKINEAPTETITPTTTTEAKENDVPKRRGTRNRDRRANTITVLPSAVREAQELISDVSSQETITDDSGLRRTRRTTGRRQSNDSVSTIDNEELSSSQSSLLKPNMDKQGRINKNNRNSKANFITTSSSNLSPSNQQKKNFKTKINSVIEKLKANNSDGTEQPVELLFEDKTNSKRKSARLSLKRTSNASDESKYEKDFKIEEPFTSSQEEPCVEVEKKIDDEVMETEEQVIVKENETNLASSKALETIPESVTDELNIQTKAIIEEEVINSQSPPATQQEEQKQQSPPVVEVTQSAPTTIIEDTNTNNIQFTKQMIPSPITTISILKKRRSMNYNLNDLPTNQNDTPSKRRVSFCDSVQIEEIESNKNAKSVFRTTPKIASINKAKLVLSPYFNKSPTSSNQNGLVENANPHAACGSPQAASNSQKHNTLSNLQAKFSILANVLSNCSSASTSATTTSTSTTSATITTTITTSSSSLPANPLSPANSLINYISINKQNFLSQRSTIIQQQMQQQQNKIESPLNSASSSIIPTAEQSYVDSGDMQLNDTAPIYPALKDCQLNLDKIVHELTSSMWSNGIIQLLKSKNMITIGDLCQLKLKEINELPFKTPKIENFLKVIQKFHAKQVEEEATSAFAVIVEQKTPTIENEGKVNDVEELTKSIKQTTPMGSLEEEMAKLEEANCLDTSIECESLNSVGDKMDISQNDESVIFIQEEEEAADKENTPENVRKDPPVKSGYFEILENLNAHLIDESKSLDTNELSEKLDNIESIDLLKLMNYVNTINLKIAQVNNLVLEKLKKSN